MEIKELIETGLTKNQAQTYLEILKHPGKSGGEIAKEISLDRSFTYNVINSLLNKGLVSYIIKENKRIFYPANPENLLKEIQEKEKKINKIVDELKSIQEETKYEKSVIVYEGNAGLKTSVRDMLSSDYFETIGSGEDLKIFEELKYEYPHYLKELKSKKAKGKLITSKLNKQSLKNIYNNLDIKIKISEDTKSKVNFTTFRDKLAIYSVEKEPFVIMIQNKDISDAFKKYFNKIWKSIK